MPITRSAKPRITIYIATVLFLVVLAGWTFVAFGRIGGQTLLMRACKRGHPIKVIKVLLAMGSNPNAASILVPRRKISVEGVTPLMFAATDGRADVTSLLLARGADPNRVDSEANSAICDAVYSPRSGLDTVQVLFQGGARLVGSGKPALACLSGAPNTRAKAKFLFDHGASVSTRTLQGEPLFVVYSRWGFTDAVQLFIDNGADVNMTSSHGRTALMEAAENGRCETVRLLLGANVRPYARDTDGQTALDLAKKAFTAEGVDRKGTDAFATVVKLLQSRQDAAQFDCDEKRSVAPDAALM